MTKKISKYVTHATNISYRIRFVTILLKLNVLTKHQAQSLNSHMSRKSTFNPPRKWSVRND